MKIGPYELHAIETGTFALDGGAMFGVVPWVFWSKTNPPDSRNRITLAARCLLAVGNGKVILIDTGNGTKWSDKLKDIYRLDNSLYTLDQSLASHGIHAEDITDVILTHLHFDHCGGSTKRENGALIPSFKNARYHVQKNQWELSQHPTDRDRGSFMNDDFAVLHDHRLLDLVDGEQEILPGISVLVTNGHTSSQQLPLISDGKTSLLFCCDLIPTIAHLPYPYVMSYDVRPLLTLEERKRIFPRAEKEQWHLFLEHDPATEVIRMQATEKGMTVKESYSLSHL